MMNKKIIAAVVAATTLSTATFAEFKVKVFLENNSIQFDVPDKITGTAELNPTIINRGESSILSWSYNYISNIDISGGTTYSSTDKSGSIPLSPLKTSNYEVTVDNGKVQNTKNLKITVIQPDPFITFTSDKTKIGEGQSVKLSWNVNNAEDAILNNNIGSVSLNSNIDVSPADDTTYTLKAIGYNQEKETSKSIAIDVVKNSNINSFTVNKNKFTIGESATFNWNVNDSEELLLSPYGLVGKSSTSQIVPLTSMGEFDYTLTTTSFNNTKKSSTLKLSVYGEPTITSYTVNDSKSVNVETGDDLIFKWNQSNGSTIKLDSNIVSGTTTTLIAPSATKNYVLEVQNGAGKKVQSTVAVNIIAPVAINTFTAPSTVFANAPFVMNWTGNNVDKYEMSGTTGSGVNNSENLNKAVTKNITPTSSGSYVYTLKATNLANKSVEKTKSVIVEADPTFTGFTVNGQESITVSPSAALSFVAVGQSSGSTLQGRNSTGTANSTLPTIASSTAGTTTYYASVSKSLNSVTRYSANRSVSVTVVSAPTISAVNAPSNVFMNSPFTLSWNGSNVTNYKIKSNDSTSGISTTDIDLGTVTSRSITPTTAGTFTYTITATNAAGVSVISTKTVIVESDPTFTGYTVNGSTTIEVIPTTLLNYVITGNSTGSTLVGRNAANTSNVTNAGNAPTTAGKYTYYGAVTKTLNAVTRYSAVRSVEVNVLKAPTVDTLTGPTNVFVGAPFTLNWTGTDAVSYRITSGSTGSGLPLGGTEIGNVNTYTVTPSYSGTYNYIITAINKLGQEGTKTLVVTVDNPPTLSTFTVNGGTDITVSPSTALTYAVTGNTAGSTLVGRNNLNNTTVINPTTAPTTSGTYTYYGAVSKTLNGVTRYSGASSVKVNVVEAPIIGSITAPTNVFGNAAFTISWTGTGVTNYKIRSNNANSGIATTDVDLSTTTSRSITPTAAGTYTYTITATNSIGVTTTATKSVIVEADPTFTGLTVNGSTSVNIAPSTALTFAGIGFSTGSSLVGRNSGNTTNSTLPTTASTSAGLTTYYAAATKTLNSVTRYSAVRSVAINVVDAPTLSSVTAPTNVFANASFSMTWAANGATNYKIKSNNAASGIATTDVDLSTATSRSITPTAAGTYTYTITATNSIGVTTTSTKSVIVEADPSFTGFTVNGSASLNIAPSSSLSFIGAGYSSGATLVGRNSANTANATLPTTASATAGSTTYYAAATKTLNGITRYSAVRSVSVTVVAGPVISAVTAPTNVFTNAAFNMSWTATGSTNYKIKSNNAGSGVSITDVDLGTTASRAITPTAAGTFTYTITATNSVGVTTTSTKSVVVESDPTFTAFTANGSTSLNVAPSTIITFAGSGYSTGATLVGRNSANTAAATLPTTSNAAAGATTYYAAATKTLNGVVRYSAVRSAVVTVVANPKITAVTAPTNVFTSAAFTMSWTATGVTSYSIRSNNAASGIATTDVALGTATSRAITPTAAGTYTYTITGVNAVGITSIATKSVIVEANPTFTGFTVNGAATASVAPSAALTFAGAGYSSGATLVGRNSANTANATLPTTASASAGSTTYYAAATKTLNGVVRYSAVRSVVVTVTNPCRNDSKNIWQVVVPPQTGGTAFYSVYWNGIQVYSVQTSSTTITSVKGSDGATYYRTTSGVGSFSVCRQ